MDKSNIFVTPKSCESRTFGYIVYAVSFFIILIFSVACKKRTPDILNDEEKLTQILIDLYIAEIAVNKSAPEYQDSLRDLYNKEIAEIYQVEQLPLDSIFKTLQMNLPKYKRISDEAVQRLGIMADSLGIIQNQTSPLNIEH